MSDPLYYLGSSKPTKSGKWPDSHSRDTYTSTWDTPFRAASIPRYSTLTKTHLQDSTSAVRIENAELKAMIEVERSQHIKAMRSMEKKAHLSETERVQSIGKLRVVREELQIARNEMQHMINERDAMLAKLNSFRNEEKDRSVWVKRLEERSNELSSELSQALNINQSAREERLHLFQEKEKLETRVQELLDHLDAMEKAFLSGEEERHRLLKALSKAQEDMRDKVEQSERYATETRRQCEDIARENENLKRSKIDLERRLEQREQALTAELSECRCIAVELRQQIHTATRDKLSAEQEQMAAQHLVQRESERREHEVQMKERAELDCRRKHELALALQHQLHQLQSEAEKRASESRSELEDVRLQLAHSLSSATHLQELLQSERERYEAQHQQNIDTTGRETKQLVQLQAEMASVRQQYDELLEKHRSAEQHIQERDLQYERIQGEITAVQREASRSAAELNDARSELSRCTEEPKIAIAELHRELELTHERASNFKKSNDELKDKTEELQTLLFDMVETHTKEATSKTKRKLKKKTVKKKPNVPFRSADTFNKKNMYGSSIEMVHEEVTRIQRRLRTMLDDNEAQYGAADAADVANDKLAAEREKLLRELGQKMQLERALRLQASRNNKLQQQQQHQQHQQQLQQLQQKEKSSSFMRPTRSSKSLLYQPRS